MTGTTPLTVTTPSDREIAMTRAFDAPRGPIWDALTQPALLKRWLGPCDWTLSTCEVDFMVGGAYRFVMRNKEGAEMGWGGVYREIAAPERFSATERFDQPWYPGEALVTYTLTEEHGRTTVTLTARYESQAARDGVLNMRIESGMAESFRKLADLLVNA